MKHVKHMIYTVNEVNQHLSFLLYSYIFGNSYKGEKDKRSNYVNHMIHIGRSIPQLDIYYTNTKSKRSSRSKQSHQSKYKIYAKRIYFMYTGNYENSFCIDYTG